MRAVQTKWFNHLPPGEQQETMKVSVISAQHVLERLADILLDKVTANAKSTTGDYNSPGWPYRQADKVGYERALVEVLDLTKISPNRESKVYAE